MAFYNEVVLVMRIKSRLESPPLTQVTVHSTSNCHGNILPRQSSESYTLLGTLEDGGTRYTSARAFASAVVSGRYLGVSSSLGTPENCTRASRFYPERGESPVKIVQHSTKSVDNYS